MLSSQARRCEMPATNSRNSNRFEQSALVVRIGRNYCPHYFLLSEQLVGTLFLAEIITSQYYMESLLCKCYPVVNGRLTVAISKAKALGCM